MVQVLIKFKFQWKKQKYKKEILKCHMFQISFDLVPISLRWFYSSAQGRTSNKSVSKGWGRPRWLKQDGWLNGCFLFLILLQHYSSIFIVVVFQLWSVPSQCQRWIPPSILGSCLHHPVVLPTISSAWDPCLSPLWQLIEDSTQVTPPPPPLSLNHHPF